MSAAHPKTISAAEAPALVRSGDWVDYGGNVSQPELFDRALAARASELREVRVRSCLTLRPHALVAADPEGERFQLYSWHFSPYDRKLADAGRIVAGEIEDGACLQIGIGGMPNAVCSVLKEAGHRDLGIHTEMFVDGMIDLIERGIVTGARKTLNRHQSVFTFALGSERLYRFIHRNPHAQSYPVDYTNLPDQIAKNDRVVAINNTTQIDLQGQAASESDGYRHLTGTGGQLEFMRGAYASKGGKSFLCLSSLYERRGEHRSRIVSTLTPGNIVTTPRTDVMYVVTEYGMVNLKGKSVPERAKALIGIAHPDYRESLAREARERGLAPRGFLS